MIDTKDLLSKFKDPQLKIVRMIFKFFRENPNPTENQIQIFLDNNHISRNIFMEKVYKVFSAFASNGLYNKSRKSIDKLDKSELAMGIKVELEHTTCVVMARRIAMDHLSEIPDYYTRLDRMESEAKS